MGSWEYRLIYIYSFGDLKAECTDQGKDQEYYKTPDPDRIGDLRKAVEDSYYRTHCRTNGHYQSHEHDEYSSCGENG